MSDKKTNEMEKGSMKKTNQKSSNEKAVKHHEEAKLPESKNEQKSKEEIKEKIDDKANEADKKSEDKIEDKKKEKPKIIKREEASAVGRNLHASLKHGMAIGHFIKRKSIDEAMHLLSEVSALRLAIPFKGEIPHRHGMMSGRYPVASIKQYMGVLKGLKGNAIAHGLDLDKTRITFASISWAARPNRRGGRKGKRANVIIKARELGDKDNG